MDVSYEKVLREKGADRPCPACGQQNWREGTGWAWRLVVEHSGDTPDIDDGRGGSEYVPVICMNCGYTRLHAREVLEG